MPDAHANHDPDTSHGAQPQPPPPRWPIILLALLCALAGASAGFFTGRPIYRSSAVLSFSGVVADGELRAQMAKSPRVAELAMVDPAWKLLGRPVSPRTIAMFCAQVGVGRTSPAVTVLTFDDPDPHAAQVSVKALVNAFATLYSESDYASVARRLTILQQREQSLASDASVLASRLNTLTAQQDGGDLEFVWRARYTQLMQLRRQLEDAESAAGSATRPADAAAAVARLKERCAREADSLRELGKAKVLAGQLRADARDVEAKRAEVRRRIDEMNLEGAMGRAAQIVSDGDLPLAPHKDPRPRRAAWGAGVALLVFLLIASIIRSWRRRSRGRNLRNAFEVVMPDSPAAPRPAMALDAPPQPDPANPA